MKIIIVRHGDPNYVTDSLTPKGKREAELLAKRIAKTDITAFYCSPLGRAQETLKIASGKTEKEYETLDWLQEFTGRIDDPVTKEKRIPWDLMPAMWTKDAKIYSGTDWFNSKVMSDGNANVKQKYDEVIAGLDRLIEKYGYKRDGAFYKVVRENSDTIALFCHFGLESVLLSHLLNISPVLVWHGFVAVPTSVTTLVTEEREQGTAYFRCSSFGDISHLWAENEEPSFSGRFCECYSNKEQRH